MAIYLQLILLTNIIMCALTAYNMHMQYMQHTSNNGGPKDNNFGMINLLRNNTGFLKINDNDNNNNNNVNLPMYQNGTNNTIVWCLTIINNNHNYN